MNQIKRILAIRLSALGDICMTLPVIESFCRQNPSVELHLVTSKLGAKIANEIITLPNFNVIAINKSDYKGISGLNRLYRELNSLHFDAVADLHDVLRTKWLDIRFSLHGIPVGVIDKGRQDKKSLVAHEINRQLTNGFDRYRVVFAQIGFSFDVDYDGQAIASLLQDPVNHVHPRSLGIAPFAQHQGKIYPADKMRSLIDLLLQKRPDLHIYLFGSKDEAHVLDDWCSSHPANIINLAGAQSINEDLRVMSKLSAMISMDSANMHLASLVGLRCFSVWGATHRFAGFLGYRQQESDCLEVDLPCRPCSIYGNKPCKYGDFRCMLNISPEIAAEKILSAFK